MTAWLRRHAVAAGLVILAAGAAAIYRDVLIAWFTGRPVSTGATSKPVRVQAGALAVDAALRPDPPRERGDTLVLAIHDAGGAPLDGATVTVTYVMPAMGAMAEMRGTGTTAARGGGRYEVGFDLPMAGSWTLEVRVATTAATATARYQITVGTRGLRALGGASAGAGDPAAEDTGEIRIEEARRGELGIRTGVVVRAPMTRSIRTVGRIAYDESRLQDVTLKLGGWISKLKVSTTGQPVHKGQILFTLYSPELYAAQQEYLIARAGPGGADDSLARAAAKKLALWGFTKAQLDELGRRGEPIENVPFPSPAAGFVIEKNVVEGAAVQAGERLFRIAALDRVWVEADVYEADLGLIQPGQRAAVALSYRPDQTFAGTVAYVYPYLDPTSRTSKVRIELPNAGLALKPDMYATVSFEIALGPRLQIPIDAVVYTGPRRLVFVDLGDGRLRPQEVTLGARADDRVEVIAGLGEGQVIVTSGNFLVAAESRIRSSSRFWTEERAAPATDGGVP